MTMVRQMRGQHIAVSHSDDIHRKIVIGSETQARSNCTHTIQILQADTLQGVKSQLPNTDGISSAAFTNVLSDEKKYFKVFFILACNLSYGKRSPIALYNDNLAVVVALPDVLTEKAGDIDK